MKFIIILIVFFLNFSNCLKAKKSPFDLSSPSGILNVGSFSLLNGQRSQLQATSNSSPSQPQSSSVQTVTISGSIQGFTSGVLVLKNSQDTLTLNPTNSYSFQNIAVGASYSIQVQTNPSNYTCIVANATGTASANVTNANITCNPLPNISALYNMNGKSWTYYVKNDGSDSYQATDSACVSTVAGGYNACLHGGEMRKLDLSTKTSCTNLTAADNLSAFNWICRITSSGIQFVSTGLKKGKGLSDLIDWSAANPNFLSMSLTIKEGSITLYQTISSVWWDNPIAVVSPSAVNTSLTTSGTIYVLTSPTPISEGTNLPQVIMGVNNLAFLIKPGIRMTAIAPTCVTSRNMIDLVNSSFSWVEGEVDATLHPGGIDFRNSTYFSVIRNFKIQNTAMDATCSAISTFAAVNIQTSNNYISNINISNSKPTGLLFYNTTAKENLIYDVTIFNSQDVTNGIGLRIDGGATKNFLSGILVSNNTVDGVSILNASHNNYLFNVTSVNNLGTGEKLASSNLLLSNVMNLNSTGDHLQLNGAPNMTLQNYVSGTTAGSHVNLSGGNTDAYFTGVFKVNSVACITAGGSTGGITAGCNGAATGTRPADINYPSTNSFLNFSATPLTQISLGQVSSDTGNAYYSTGINVYSLSNNWNGFQNFYRGIGKSGAFPSTAIRGACSAGNCQLYDWTLKTTDTIGLNTNPCSGNTSQLPATTITHPLNGGGSVTFLRNAVEIIGDGIGNENGFCESSEACLFTPNIGAYQGHGNLISASTASPNTLVCSDAGNTGSVINVTLYKYENNGY